MCKGIKCKISTPKYMQINLKRNGLANVNENSAIDGKTRDKSTNCSKKGKLCIEFSKINSLNKARGVSADEVMKVPDGDGGQKEQKSSKPPKNKQIKTSFKVQKSSREQKINNLTSSIIHNKSHREDNNKSGKQSRKLSCNNSNSSYREIEKERLEESSVEDSKKMPAEPANIKTLKLFFAKDPDHQSSKEHSKCRNEERVRNTIEQEHTSETDVKENLKIVTDKIMLNNTEDFLPDFGYNKDVPHLKMKKIRSEKGCSDQESEREKINFSCRAFRSNSKRSSFEIKLSSKERSNKLNINVLSSSNSSRSKSKEKKGFALTMNPISTTNFKFAIGNLPIKVSRDDDMLFSFRNQVVTNRSIKENDSNQIPEYITSRYGERSPIYSLILKIM